MSDQYALVPVWLLPLNLHETEMLVYITISSFCDRDRTCTPKQQTIADRAGLKLAAINKAVSSLRGRGVLTTTRKAGGLVYYLPLTRPAQVSDTSPAYVSTRSKEVEQTTEHTNSGFAAAGAQALAKVYYDRVPMSNFPAVLNICKKAISAKYDPVDIEKALLRLADNRRALTVNTLRIELEGPPRGQAVRYTSSDRDSADWNEQAGFSARF